MKGLLLFFSAWPWGWAHIEKLWPISTQQKSATKSFHEQAHAVTELQIENQELKIAQTAVCPQTDKKEQIIYFKLDLW